jgi:phosphoglucosamine mutase
MTIRFGTDGVRGLANEAITVEAALAIGRATASTFASERVVVGRDTRRSGPMLEAAVVAGLCSEGVDVVALGVVPTPAVAAVCAQLGAPGVMISASHNPFEDNGLKIFSSGGQKLSDDQQRAVESAIAAFADGRPHTGPTGARVGTVIHDSSAVQHYLDTVAAVVEGRSLDGLSVVVDCANGSNSFVAGPLFERLGARVSVIHADPDGSNINDTCGSTHPESLGAAVVDAGADIGIAFDGDADRMLAVDHRGQPVDGDQIIALCAVDLAARNRLAHRAVVVTVMSNLGFHQAMRREGIDVVTTPVGDRHVLQALVDGGYSLGGEQSGHIIFTEVATTGDGLLSAVALTDLVRRAGRPLSELAAGVMTRLPQVLVNVRVDEPVPDVAERLSDEIAAVEAELGASGRVLLRPSGTEPVVRVMAEAPTEEQAERVARRLAAAVEAM